MDDHRRLLEQNDPEVFVQIRGEERRQWSGVELIPSENYTYPEVLAALGTVLTNKYSEGYPGSRYYGGQEFTDGIENIARDRARELFRCEHANVQPLSGSPMNQAVYFAVLEPGDTVLAMDLSHGGHLTHGSPASHMGRLFNFVRYKTRPDREGSVDFDELLALARSAKPKIVLCGTTSSPRADDFGAYRRIADEVGALAMADISHIGGLVAGGAMQNPFDAGFDFVTTTTHKSLRGPRAGIVMCRKEHAKSIDRSVFPGLQGGPHMNNVAAIAVTLGKAQEPDFGSYARQILRNAQALAETLLETGAVLVTGGTDNHMLVVDTVLSCGIDGRAAEATLDSIGITTNRQIIPDDPNSALRPSGIRLGTPAATTRGMKEGDLQQLGRWIASALEKPMDTAALAGLRREVEAFCNAFPVPGICDREIRDPESGERAEDRIGSIEIGKQADFTIVDRSPLRVDPDDLDRIEVTETGLGGRRPALYFALRGVFEDGTPPPFWAWDVVWTVIFPGILLIPIFLGRMVALVERGELIIRFGFFSGGGKKIPLELIERAEPISYRPIRQFGGWGVRFGTYDGAKTAVYSLGGSNGVLLTLKDPMKTLFLRTDKILIGNQSHYRLADYLSRVT